MAIDRMLPQNITAEEAVLGSILIDSDAWAEANFLEPADFYRDAHTLIYRTMQELWAEDIGIDILTVEDALARAGLVEDAGGPGYVASLVNAVPTSAHVSYYARIVLRAAAARAMVHQAGQMAAAAYNEHDIFHALDTQATEVARLQSRFLRQEQAERLYTLSEALQRPQAPTIWKGILNKGERLEVFGESGSGKTFEGIGLSTCFMLGEQWHTWKTEASGNVFYLTAEDFAGAAMRFHAALNYRHLPPSAVEDKLMIYDGAVNLRAPEDVQRLIGHIKRRGFYPDLLVIDSYSLCFEGSDIDGQQNREAFKGIGALQAAFPDAEGIQATAAIINHTNKAGVYYGHSSHKNFVTSMLEVSKEVSLVTLRWEKTRNSELPPSLHLKFHPVPVNALTGLTSCVLVGADEADIAALHEREVEALDVLAGIGNQGARATDWEKAWRAKTKLSEGTFKGIKARLEKVGYVEKESGQRGLFKASPAGLALIGSKGQGKDNAPSVPMGEGKGQRDSSIYTAVPLTLSDAPLENEDRCMVCGAEADNYGPDGQPYCERHKP